MKAYKIKSKTGKKFWTVQLPIDDESAEEVIAEADISEDFVKDLDDEDKNYLILELTQALRFTHVEEKIVAEKNKVKRKARKSL